MNIFLSTATSFFFGFLMTPVLIMLLKKINFMEAPGGRKIHAGSIPSMGGIAIIFATFLGLFAWLSFDQIVETRYFLVALGIMFSVGLRDDLIELTAAQKLIGQSIPAFFVIVMADIRISGLYGFMGIYEIPYLISVLITFFAILILTNSFNLIDGADGLAGSLSLVTLTILGIWFFSLGMTAYSLISFTLVGGVVAFLAFNWHPAKIFMGDTGSLSLGFALVVLVILFVDKSGTMAPWEGLKVNAPFSAGMAFLIVPIYDTVRIFIKRSLKGKSPLKPDKSHVHHFLLRMGLKHDQVALTLGTVKLGFIGLVFFGYALNDHILFPVLTLVAVSLGIWMDKQTLKNIKSNCKKAPSLSEKGEVRKKKRFVRRKPEISKSVLSDNKINMN
ncbi:UDP-N-acetylmuramyl pentapeptide phosphotransferase/UDP-N-acetylglucosamine-1-phosphate transferase [Cyclobacterium lianum]|uniref:UDP-N-acetylmuramyl pentapeptide phosphotransferase/UDP-N-acetylglucosamine-1-phosphate transferase n=1 Tax=Cyclobacterium lianum TaxID=388280 RepID=A0A1M7ND32_9BACT|nr:MraY family glycosyltransferase [Cyclobacterium lianum]SHN01622.1 UDP-N-acetylmuramyl pentapeptide phosphotransferase/UDP-N-acetylglucosamine-1-phosphate transferase [Cyclobacterium lianum]